MACLRTHWHLKTTKMLLFYTLKILLRIVHGCLVISQPLWLWLSGEPCDKYCTPRLSVMWLNLLDISCSLIHRWLRYIHFVLFNWVWDGICWWCIISLCFFPFIYNKMVLQSNHRWGSQYLVWSQEQVPLWQELTRVLACWSSCIWNYD